MNKNIKDYRTAHIMDLRTDRPLPCDVFLYFERNQHLVLWKKKDFMFEKGGLEPYLDKGLRKVWIHRNDALDFEKYLAPALLDPPTLEEPPVDSRRAAEAATETSEEVPADPSEVTEITARYLLTLLRTALYNDRQKRALIAKAVRILLGRAAKPNKVEEQAAENFKLQELVRELVTKINRDDRSMLHKASHQIWKFAETDPTLTHSLNVAAYSVLMAMAFGRIDEELLSEISSAALIHDIGISQQVLPIPQIPLTQMTLDQRRAYEKHVPAALDLFSAFISDMPARVLTLVEQTHECFDGSGYPHRWKESEIHQASQIISIADMVDTIASGAWDGRERTFNDAILVLEENENNALAGVAGSSQHFKAEVFSAMARWIRESRAA
jgi:HD-GYP domain-containing protein (c-di-GMP phosphodiesterase class II)